jgi:hypothetical protein
MLKRPFADRECKRLLGAATPAARPWSTRAPRQRPRLAYTSSQTLWGRPRERRVGECRGRDCTRAEVVCTQQTLLRYAHIAYEITRDVVGIRQLPPASAVWRYRRAKDRSRSEYQRVCCLCLPPAGSPVCGRERAARQRQRWSPLSRYTRSWS